MNYYKESKEFAKKYVAPYSKRSDEEGKPLRVI